LDSLAHGGAHERILKRPQIVIPVILFRDPEQRTVLIDHQVFQHAFLRERDFPSLCHLRHSLQ